MALLFIVEKRQLSPLGGSLPEWQHSLSAEIAAQSFGKLTRRLFAGVLTDLDLPVTKFVDETIAESLNHLLEELRAFSPLVPPLPPLEPDGFIVQGQVHRMDGSPVVDMVVRAFDNDLRDAELLGETTTDSGGRYHLAYTAKQFLRDEKKSADLVMRVFTPLGIQVAESEILFNAPPEARLDLVVEDGQDLQPSEFEELMAAVSPVLGRVRPADLTDEDLVFLVGETGLDRRRLHSLRRAAMLSHDSRLPLAAHYAWARESLPLTLAELLALEPEAPRWALESAIDQGIAPARLRQQLEQIVQRMEQLRFERGFLLAHTLRGRLRRREAPLAGFSVRGLDLEAGRELGYDVSDGSGLFSLTYTTPRETASERRVHLRILDPQGAPVYQTEITVPPDRDEVLEIQIPVEVLPDPPSPSVAELATTLQIEVPGQLLAALGEQGIHTLADIRTAGGIGRIEGLQAPPAVVETLDAHANLSIVSSDVRANAALIEKGYTSLARIARAAPADFVFATHETLGDFKAAQLQVQARGVDNLLGGAVMELKSGQANGYEYLDPGLNAVRPQVAWTQCECEECETAVSPLAYLADLLDYAVSHVENDGAAIDLAFLTETFHQPFGDLPTSCPDVGRQVRQVRICIEVLHDYLTANNKSLPDSALADYLLQAYTMLLTKIGTSYEEIRLAKTADLAARRDLADRLGLDFEPAGPDHLGALVLAPPDQNGQSPPLDEQVLEQLFGLVDTTRDPFSDGVKLGDLQGRITRWSLSGVEWGRSTDADGIIYVSIKKPQASVAQIDLYKDAQRTAPDLVASGKGPVGQDITVSQRSNSGLSGTFEVTSAAANKAIEIQAVPRLLSWRLQHLRTLWRQQDWPSDPYSEGQAVVELKQLPQGLQFPAALAGKISYGAENQLLVFDGVMNEAERSALLAASFEPAYTQAIDRLFRRSQRLPVVDPDLVGPDDFRVPFAKASAADPDLAFDLWLKRRAWVDARLDELSALRTAASNKVNLEALPDDVEFPLSLQGVIAYEPAFKALIFTGVMSDAERELLLGLSQDALYQEAVEQLFTVSQEPPFEVPDLPAMLAVMYEPATYDGTSLTTWSEQTTLGDLDGLAEKLAAGLEVEDTAERIQADLNLTVESFSHLLAIRAKDQLAAVDPQSEPVKPEEWQEVCSILAQARKASLFPAWYAEERAKSLPFDPTTFWISLREPKEGTWPPLFPEPSQQRPIVDPESVERGDLPELLAGRRAIILWEARRARLAQITEELKTAHEEQGFEAMLRRALGEPDFADPLPLPPGVTLSTLLIDLGSNDPAEVSAAEETVSQVLHMTPEAFTRLMAVEATGHTTAANWAEVYATLTTAQKEHREFPVWIGEEQQAGLAVEYWRALKAALPRWRASAEGRVTWQQALRVRGSAPLIDPDLLVTADFRDPFSDRPAFHLKQERAAWITDQLDALAGAPASLSGLDSMAVETLIGPGLEAGTRTDLQTMRAVSGLEGVLTQLWGRPLPDLETLLADLTGGSEAVAAAARNTITTSLFLTVDDFEAFMAVWNKTVAALPITDAEWDLIDEILTPTALVQSVFSLGDDRQRGVDISGRLDQLGLEPDAFASLLRARELLAAGAALLESEWEAIRNILVQVRKRHTFAEWTETERANYLVLGPDEFQIPPPPPVQFPPKPAAELPAWRASWSARLHWQESLQSRIDQVHATVEGFHESVDDAEAAALPLLRDALILASNVSGGGLGAKASAITDLLLIDAKTSACQLTTRVAQAIETLQGLLFAARTRQLDTHLHLSLEAPDFDEEWKWLGSYATWRAAMLVFLYPEIALVPSLRKSARQTPAFRKLLDDLRSNRRFDPEVACTSARAYAAYFRDVCNLTVEASCRAEARVDVGDCRSDISDQPAYRELFYLFARSTVSNTFYISAYTPDDNTGYGQSFWESLPASPRFRISQIIGAVPYKRNDQERRLYVFGRVEEDGPRLAFITYDLEQPGWGADWEELQLDLPDDVTFHGMVVVQRAWVDTPPTVVVDAKGQYSHRFYARSLNVDGTAWEEPPHAENSTDSDWDAFLLISGEMYQSYIGNKSTLHQAIQVWVDEQGTTGSHYSWMLSLVDDETYERIVAEVNQSSADESPVGVSSWPIDGNFVGATPSEHNQAGIVVFTSNYGTSLQHFIAANKTFVTDVPHVASLVRVVPDNGDFLGEAGKRSLIYGIEPAVPGAASEIYRFEFETSSVGADVNAEDEAWSEVWTEVSRTRATPSVGDGGTESSPSFAFVISERLSPAELQVKRDTIATWYPENKSDANGSATNLTYLEEAYYFVPVQIALQLQRNGFYQEALDWFRTVYDFTAAIPDAKIYYGLTDEHDLPLISQRAEHWLLDPLDPHFIGAARRDTSTRFTLLSIVRCLLEFADAEFTRDTVESVPRARTLYLTALKLLDRNELKQNPFNCKDIVVSLDQADGDQHLVDLLKKDILVLKDITQVGQVTQQVNAVLAESGGFEQAWGIVSDARAAMPPSQRLGTVVEGKAAQVDQAHAALLSQPDLASAAGRVGVAIANDYEQAVSRFTGLSGAALAKATLPWLREPTTHGNGATPMHAMSGNGGPASASFDRPFTRYVPPSYVPTPPYRFCIPPNPIPEALRLRAELNLFKIRNCRNIAGLERQLEPYAAPTDAVSGLLLIDTEDQLMLPGLTKLAPSPYRYPVLIERAKHLVGLAQQIEAAFLFTLERADDARYSALKARQDVRLAWAGVRLQTLRVREAESGVTLAFLQQERAQVQVDHYHRMLIEGFTTLESLGMYSTMVSGLVNSVASFGTGSPEAVGSVLAPYASHERREQDWQLQKSLAEQDVLIGGQQVKIAQDHVRVAGQERLIAEMQAGHAEAVVDFLTNKFTNLELYDWMSDVLARVYSFFLQQATAMAQVAANQLAFERQEVPPPFIRADYWQAPGDEGMDGSDGKAPDRRGLTGSARLLQDIYQLDQYAFETNKRKLQLTKTISLARLPDEFQRFRETGVMTFATPMELFDRDFPGHYLRLIRRVRASVIALIPPSHGIRATLSTTGTSRVVIGGDVFQTVVVNHGPQSVALDSPRDATGLFELDQQPELLGPFEGLGVATNWEFRMPKAANPFDYRTIADVLITIEYTALNSFDYYQRVTQSPALTQPLSFDRPFSFRHQFADQWYDLLNPDQTTTPMTVRFLTTRDDFPPNLENVKIQHVALYFGRPDALSFEVPVAALKLTSASGYGAVGGGAISVDGLISTRQGNAGSWTSMLGMPPIGEWELMFPNTAEVRDRFTNEEIEDMLLVITVSGRTPEWPA
jgi:hypothetical protein